MLNKYNGKRTIAVLEISSTAIKRCSGIPKECLSKKNDIKRFKDTVKPIYLTEYIVGDTLNITAYKKGILPLILDAVKLIQNTAPQIYKIVFTGLYRNITNWNELNQLLYEEITKLKRKQPQGVELLSPEKESSLSFISWFETTSSVEVNSQTHDSYFILNRGLNIDLGGGTTEISLVEFGSFKNTVSLPFGAEQLSLNIKSTNYINKQHFYNHIDGLALKLQNTITKYLKKEFLSFEKVHYCICSGSNVIISGGDNEVNSRKEREAKRINWFLQEYRNMMIDIIFPYLEKKLPIPEKHEKLFKWYCSHVILKSIIDYFEVESYTLNMANLRIGVFYELLELLHPTYKKDQL